MMKRLIFAAGSSSALTCAVQELEKLGCDVTDRPSPDVTHLLVPVPCRLDADALTGILHRLPQSVTVVGGFLHRPELEQYDCIDLLEDAQYQAENAMITAYGAIRLAADALPVIWKDCPVLILGWGRIGKCLSKLLCALGAEVSVAARKEADLAMITALGCDGQSIAELNYILRRYRVIFNTVPSPVLSAEQTAHCRKDCVMVELASVPGMNADHVVDGRGLPGKLTPESSGKLIARTVMRLCSRKEAAL